MPARHLPALRMLAAQGETPFAAWRAKADRIAY
jgi:hypothetical protein